MPLALLAIAWLVIMTGINGNYQQVGSQFEQDVMGGGQGGGFISFLVGLVGIAAFFRIIDMPNAGKIFMSLVILVFLMKNANVLTVLENLAAGTSTASQSSAAASGAGVAQAPASTAATTSTPAAAPAATTSGTTQ